MTAPLHVNRKMVDTAPVMIWFAGPDQHCAFINKAWVDFTGRRIDQELGNAWAEAVVHPDDVGGCREAYSSAFRARRNFQAEYRFRRADGQYRWLLVNGAPRLAPDGQFTGYICACIDVTHLKYAQEELFAKQNIENIGVLTSGIAHDFGNLLSGIIAHGELLLEDLQRESPSGKEVQAIRDLAMRGCEIVREMIIYTRQGEPDLQLLDMSSLVKEMLELLRISVSKQATLRARLGDKLPPVLASATHIRQIIMNLIINASDAVGDGPGLIHVATSCMTAGQSSAASHSPSLPSRKHVTLEVTDSGPGIPREIQSKIFDPFFTTKPEGRGLGLTIVQSIVRNYGGTVNVASRPGKATRFRVVLPVATESASQSRNAKRAHS